MAFRIMVFERPGHTVPDLSEGVREFLCDLVIEIVERPEDGYYHVSPSDVYMALLGRAPAHAVQLHSACLGRETLAIPHQACRKMAETCTVSLGFDLTVADRAIVN